MGTFQNVEKNIYVFTGCCSLKMSLQLRLRPTPEKLHICDMLDLICFHYDSTDLNSYTLQVWILKIILPFPVATSADTHSFN